MLSDGAYTQFAFQIAENIFVVAVTENDVKLTKKGKAAAASIHLRQAVHLIGG